MPGLIVALKNEKAAYWACLVLREIGPAAKDAVPALAEKLRDSRPEIRREAILALAAMDDAAIPALAPIAAALGDEHTRAAATYALGRIGRIPAEAEAVDPGERQERRQDAQHDKPLGLGPRPPGRQAASTRGDGAVDRAAEGSGSAGAGRRLPGRWPPCRPLRKSRRPFGRRRFRTRMRRPSVTRWMPWRHWARRPCRD